jgi:hypothetical protein
MQLSDAKLTLQNAGFKMQILDTTDNLLCPSRAPYGTVAFYGPTIAESGATITVCRSSGVLQPVFVPPPPKPKPTKTSGGSQPGGVSTTPSPPGHGHGH